MTFRASSGGWGRSPGRMGSSGGSFSDIVASWFNTSNAPGRFDPGFRDWATSGALFQDSAGTTPVTALEQPVGLRLDRSRGLVRGPDVALASSVNGVAAGGPAVTLYPIANGLVVGRMYEVTATVSNYSGTSDLGFAGGDAFAGVPTGTGRTLLGNGVMTFRFPAASTSQNMFTRSTNTANFTNISIKEIPGAHRIQPTTTKRPILSGRKNWLAASEDITAVSAWTPAISPVIGRTPGGTALPSGIQSGSTIAFPSASAYVIQSFPRTVVIGDKYTFSHYLNANTKLLFIGGATPAGTDVYTVEDVGGGWYRHVLTRTFTVAATGSIQTLLFGANAVLNQTYQTTGMMLEFTPTVGRYQRTGLNPQTGDYDAVGFPIGLLYDGVDDGMYTAAPIDYSGTDKVTMTYPVYKASDAALGMLNEFGPNVAATPGTFYITAPESTGASGDYACRTRVGAGTNVGKNVVAVAPNASVLSLQVDGTAATLELQARFRVNGALIVGTNVGALGNGSYTSQISYEGARADASLRFNGMVYGEFQWGDTTALSADRLTYIESQFARLLLEQ